MSVVEPLVNDRYLLERFPGKGGWTYAMVPEIPPDKKAPFGWVKVRGSIDDVEIGHIRLMPMGNGKLFLPVKASLRKALGKKAGDHVHVTLYADDTPTYIPDEFLDCLKEAPEAYNVFLSYTDGQQKEFVDWIYAAKTEATMVKRITEALRMLEKRQKLRDARSDR